MILVNISLIKLTNMTKNTRKQESMTLFQFESLSQNCDVVSQMAHFRYYLESWGLKMNHYFNVCWHSWEFLTWNPTANVIHQLIEETTNLWKLAQQSWPFDAHITKSPNEDDDAVDDSPLRRSSFSVSCIIFHVVASSAFAVLGQQIIAVWIEFHCRSHYSFSEP